MLKENMPEKNKWNRFILIEGLIGCNFIFSTVVFIVNDIVIEFISRTNIGYYFWLSFGLFLGFHICKAEFKRYRNK